jgi:hypothetical protein
MRTRLRTRRASGIPRSPLIEGGTFEQNSGASRGEKVKSYLTVIASEARDDGAIRWNWLFEI